MAKKPTQATLTRHDRRPRSEDARIAPWLREMYRLLLDRARLRAWNRVLSVESGDGWAAEEAWRRLGRGYVCGVDVSSRMTEHATSLRSVEGALEFRTWDGGNLPFPDGHFDCVIATFAMHRYAEPLRALAEMTRVLSPTGDLYLLEPDRKSFGGLYVLWDYYFRLTDPGHVRYYGTEDLLRLMREAGVVEGKELMRYERMLSKGKLLASAVVLHARQPAGSAAI